MINFRIAPHTHRPGDAVEIWQGHAMVGVLYGLEDRVRLVSKYFDAEDSFQMEPGRPGVPGVVEVHFDPKKQEADHDR